MGPRRRLTSIGSVVAVAALPLTLTTSAPLMPTAHVAPAARPADVAAWLRANRSEDRQVAATAAPTVLEERRSSLPKNGEVRVSSPKGTRVWSVSALADHGLPVAAMRAYRHAAGLMARTDPACGLPWTLLAGIGRVESDHGRYGGARLGDDGVSRPRIIGVALDGAGPVAAIHDTDRGRLDGDTLWDRAVGPLQFIPATWRSVARDGDGDGRMSPFDLDDAAAAAASYLCSGSGSLRDPATQAAAIYRYNQDDYYVALVQAFEVGYRTGVFDIPAPPADPPHARHHRKHRRHTAAQPGGRADGARGGRTGSPGTAARPKPATGTEPGKPKPTAPRTSPAPSPSPTPSPAPTPQPTSVTATLTQGSDGGYLLGGKALDLGIVGEPDATAVGDFDKDGTVEQNADELAGMLGRQVTMVVVQLDSGKLGIYSINGVALG